MWVGQYTEEVSTEARQLDADHIVPLKEIKRLQARKKTIVNQEERIKNYLTSGFDSIWQRMIRKALKETELTERFTEHDLRAKVASDTDLSHAQGLMDHASANTTERIYRRKAKVVEPAKWKAK